MVISVSELRGPLALLLLYYEKKLPNGIKIEFRWNSHLISIASNFWNIWTNFIQNSFQIHRFMSNLQWCLLPTKDFALHILYRFIRTFFREC